MNSVRNTFWFKSEKFVGYVWTDFCADIGVDEDAIPSLFTGVHTIDDAVGVNKINIELVVAATYE